MEYDHLLSASLSMLIQCDDVVPIIMVAWGLVMTLMCLVKTYPQLLV